jgi:hypothetical protein
LIRGELPSRDSLHLDTAEVGTRTFQLGPPSFKQRNLDSVMCHRQGLSPIFWKETPLNNLRPIDTTAIYRDEETPEVLQEIYQDETVPTKLSKLDTSTRIAGQKQHTPG